MITPAPRFARAAVTAVLTLSCLAAPTTALAQTTPPPATTAPAATPAVGLGPFAQGAVVALKGTPHQWVADERGTLHWAADTRVLAGRTVNTANRTEVTAEQLATLPRGEPWLGAPLVKLGDPIYVPTWAAGATQPSLLHVQSPADLLLFGLEGPTFDRMVLGQSAWEQRQGMQVASLTRGELPAAAPGGRPAAPAWAPMSSPGGGFAVWAPGFALPAPAGTIPPLAQAAENGSPFAADIPNDVHVMVFGGYFDGPAVLYLAGSATLPDEALEQLDLLGPDAAFELVRAELAKSDRVRLLAYRTITQGTYRGREIALEPVQPPDDPFAGLPGARGLPLSPNGTPTVTLTLRILLVGDKVYLAGVVTTPSASPLQASPMAADIARFLDSFRLLPAA